MTPLPDKLNDAAAILTHLPHAYTHAHNLIIHPPGRTTDTAPPGHPSGRPPAGIDTRIRAALIRAARALADAHHHLAAWQTPHPTWQPQLTQPAADGHTAAAGLGFRWTEAVIDCAHGREWPTPDGDQLPQPPECCAATPADDLVIAPRFAPRWSPAAHDLAVALPDPDTIADAAASLVTLYRWVATLDLTSEKIPRRSAGAVNRARAHLVLAGLWEPDEAKESHVRRCTRPWCRVQVHAKGLCQEHYDEQRRSA